MFSTISKDKIFFDFLSQKLNINDEAKNFKKKKKEANQYNETQILPEIDYKVTHNKKRNMFNNINDYNLQSLNSITSSGFSSNKYIMKVKLRASLQLIISGSQE